MEKVCIQADRTPWHLPRLAKSADRTCLINAQSERNTTMSLPEAFTHQDKLLTVDTNLSKFVEGLLHPGIKAHPLFLDPFNGVWVLRWTDCTASDRLRLRA
jgi:hypothetical protein